MTEIDSIIQKLLESSIARNFVPSFSFHLKELNSLLDLKVPVDIQQRLLCINILYPLLNVEVGIDPFLIQGISNSLQRLLKKNKLKGSNLLLDWKVLYNQLKLVHFAKNADTPLPGVLKHYSSLFKLVVIAKEYFDAKETIGIMQEFLPRINLNNTRESGTRLVFLVLFLPTKGLECGKWVQVILEIWKFVVQDSTIDQLFLGLFAGLAQDQINSNPRDVGISKELVSWIITRGQASMGLPVDSNTKSTLHQSLKQEVTSWVESRLNSLAKFLIWTLFPGNLYDLGTWKHLGMRIGSLYLEILLQAIEGYYHPSNSGRWSSGLSKFLQNLSTQYLKRMRIEKMENCDIPQENRLTTADHEAFVNALRPLALMSMFSKDSSAINSTHLALKNLAWIAPELILPPLLDRIYPSLESLTESHRTISSIGALCAVSRPLFTFSHFPQGASHLVPLLSLVLPGIDMNDPSKSSATLLFIILLLHTVPLVECKSVADSSSEEDDFLRLNTIGLNDWVLNFLSRIIMLFENLPEGHESSQNNRQTSETSLIEMVMWSCEMIFCQASSAIQEACMSKMINFVSKNVIPNATKAISFVCGSIHGQNPSRRLAVFFPLCRNNILGELEAGASKEVGGSHLTSNQNPFGFAKMSDAPFHYYQSILISCIHSSGESLLKYRNDLVEILHKTHESCVSRRGYKWAAKLLRSICFSLSSRYIKDTRSHNAQTWDSPDFQSHTFKYYGETIHPDELSIDWHIPSEAEISCSMEILEDLAERTLQNISQITDPLSPDFRNNICRWLCWMKSIIVSLNSVLEPQASVFNPSQDDVFQQPHTRRPIQGIYAVPQNHKYFLKLTNLRNACGMELARIARLLLGGQGEDSIEAVKSLIKNIFLFMTYRGTENGRFDGFNRLLNFLKSMIKSEEDHKRLPRTYTSKREYLIHLTRLKYNSSKSEYEPLYQELIDSIFQFTISKYSQIRQDSLPFLGRILRCFTSYKYDLFMKYLKIMDVASSAEKDDNLIDGACQAFRSSSFLGMTLRNWPFARSLLLAFVKAEKNIEKPKSLEILRKLFFDYIMQFSGIPFRYSMTTSLDHKILAVDNNLVNRMQIVAMKKTSLSVQNYNDLLKDMVVLLNESSLHWRFSGMALNFLGLILCEDQPVPAQLTSYVVQNIVNEHPTLRKSCMALAIRILIVHKKRATEKGNNKIESLKKEVVLFSDKEDEFLQSFRNCLNSADSRYYAHLSYRSAYIDYGSNIGWICFPKTIRGYVNGAEDISFFDDSSPESEIFLKNMVHDVKFWDTFLGFMSQESAHESSESFNFSAFLFYKRLFSRFGPNPLEFSVDSVKKHILDVADKSKQRASCEYLSGVIRGSKHWSKDSRSKMWQMIIPLIKIGVQSCTTDSARFWGEFVRISCVCESYFNLQGKMDPRRVKPLIDLIFGWKFEPESESFFTESKKLAFANELFLTFSWRIYPMLMDYLDLYHKHLNNPYKAIRDTLGKLLCNLINLQWHCSVKNVEEVIKNPSLLKPSENSLIKKMMENIVNDLESSRLENNVSKYQNISKSVLSFALEYLQSYQIVGSPYLMICMPEIFLMQDSSDLDLQILAKHVFQVSFPVFPHNEFVLNETLELFMAILKNMNNNNLAVTWHRKKRILPALQVIYYHNLHILHDSWKEKVLDCVNELLLDSQIEIRQLAARTLSGLIRCSNRVAINKIRNSAINFLVNVKIPRKSKEISQDMLFKCHASILALGALILAFPYEIVDWMPESLVALAHCVSYVSPIGVEVKKIFAEFRRTHQDNWHEDKAKFTDDQLNELSDLLISPSYYV